MMLLIDEKMRGHRFFILSTEHGMTRNVKIEGGVFVGREHPGNLFEPAQIFK